MAKFNQKRGGGRGGDRDRKPKNNRGGRDRSDSDSRGPKKSNDGQRRQGGNEGLKVERRDQSKQIKKGGKDGPKKITIESLRRGDGERGGQGKGKGKGQMQKQGGRGDNDGQKGDNKRGGKDQGRRGGKGGDRKGGKKGGKPFKKPVKQTADDLDKEMESYWVKGGHTEVANQRLDDDLANYFDKQDEVPAAEPASGEQAAEETGAAEQKTE